MTEAIVVDPCITRRDGWVWLVESGAEIRDACTVAGRAQRSDVVGGTQSIAPQQTQVKFFQSRMSGLSEEEQRRYGNVARALIGLGSAIKIKASGEIGTGSFAEEDFGVSVQELKDQITDLDQDLPTGAACAIALIEQCWVPTL